MVEKIADLMKEPVFLYSLTAGMGMGGLYLFLRLVKLVGIRVLELCLLIIMSCLISFSWGGWFFYKNHGRSLQKRVKKIKKRPTDVKNIKKQIKGAVKDLKK